MKKNVKKLTKSAAFRRATMKVEVPKSPPAVARVYVCEVNRMLDAQKELNDILASGGWVIIDHRETSAGDMMFTLARDLSPKDDGGGAA